MEFTSLREKLPRKDAVTAGFVEVPFRICVKTRFRALWRRSPSAEVIDPQERRSEAAATIRGFHRGFSGRQVI